MTKGTTTARDARTPIRTCVGCRERRPQAELVRCVLDRDGAVRLSRTAPGRGAWICGPECLSGAIRRRGFEHTWRSRIDPAALDALGDLLNENIDGPGHCERPGCCETDTTTKG